MTKLQNDEILVREIIDIDTNYMEDEDTGQSAKQKKSDDGSDNQNKRITTPILTMMNLIQLLQRWKLKLNLKSYKQLII